MQVRESFCKTLEDMCKDWMGNRDISYSIQFQCPKPGCTERHPLALCDHIEEFLHCGKHDISLNDIRELFGE